MDKQDWEDTVREPMSESLKSRTMARARMELGKKSKAPGFSWAWLIPIIPALGVFALLFRRIQEDGSASTENFVSEMEYMDELTGMDANGLAEFDPDLIGDLEFLEDLDVLEGWNGTAEDS